jgi:hypothetical protein
MSHLDTIHLDLHILLHTISPSQHFCIQLIVSTIKPSSSVKQEHKDTKTTADISNTSVLTSFD